MTIIRRGAKFGVSVKDPTHPKGQRWVGTFDTEKIALEEEAAAKREARLATEARSDGTRPGNVTTVQGYIDRFTLNYVDRLESSTRHNYKLALIKLAAAYGDREMHTITRDEAVRWTESIPRWVSKRTQTMFKRALHDGVVNTNPFDGIILPPAGKRGRGGDRLIVVTDAQLTDLINAARAQHPGPFGEGFATLLTVAAYTAMRPGELFALKWEDIDLKARRINVRRSRAYGGSEKLPKNGKARRIVLPKPAAAVLATLPRSGPLVFTSKTGRQLSPATFAMAWQPVRAASGAPIMDVYELRHYCATKLMEAGLHDWQVAEQMGHEDNGLLVRQTYFHPKKEDILDAIDGAWAA